VAAEEGGERRKGGREGERGAWRGELYAMSGMRDLLTTKDYFSQEFSSGFRPRNRNVDGRVSTD